MPELTNEQITARDRLSADIDRTLKAQGIKIDEPVVAKTETTEATATTEESKVVEISEAEKQARALGWRPKTEYSGSHFVEADEYVRRQPLFERIEKQSKEVRELKDMQRKTMENMAQIRKEAYDKAIKDLEFKQQQEVSEGNLQAFNESKTQIQRLQIQQMQDPVINAQVPTIEPEPVKLSPELLDFQKKNGGWYNGDNRENLKMKLAADTVDNFLIRQAQVDQGLDFNTQPRINVSEHLKAIETEVKRLFPNRFQSEKTPIASAVGKSTASKEVSKDTGTALVSKMTPNQKEMGEYFVTHKAYKSIEDYAKDLEKQGNLGK